MNSGRKTPPDRRLAALMAEPGGMRADDAIRRANERLAAVRDACVAGLDVRIRELQLFADARSPDGLALAYHAAKEIYGLGGTYGLTELSGAAHSLCELLARTGDSAGAIPWMGVRVHIDALKQLRHPSLGADAPARVAIVQGLRQLSARAS